MNGELLDLDNLSFDFDNPRIVRHLENYSPESLNFEKIALALGAESGTTSEGETYASYDSLKESIRCHGGLIHPILVNRTEKHKLTVIEGNTRLMIFRQLRDSKVEGDWSKIPAIVHDNMTPLELNALRLQAHLVGPRPWDPYSKAKYLHWLRENKCMSITQIVDFCGGKKSEVHNYINAYEDMEKYYREALSIDERFDASRFSAFVEFQRKSILNAVLDAGFEKADFARWVIDHRFPTLAKVRGLPRVLKDPEATRVFLEDGNNIEDAERHLDSKLLRDGPELDKISLEQLARATDMQIGKLPYDMVKRMKEDPQDPTREALEHLRFIINEFGADIFDIDGN